MQRCCVVSHSILFILINIPSGGTAIHGLINDVLVIEFGQNGKNFGVLEPILVEFGHLFSINKYGMFIRENTFIRKIQYAICIY